MVLELWEKIVNPEVWYKFASLRLHKWLEYNLQSHEVGMGDLHWPIIFGLLVHMLWIDHNHYVFLGKLSLPDLILPKLFAQVDKLHSILLNQASAFVEASHEVIVKWLPPPMDIFKLNTDGSHINGLSACGGLLRNSLGNFIQGFYCNLGAATSVAAELWGLVLGLRTTRSLGITTLEVEMDSSVVVNMVQLRKFQCSFLRPLLEEAVVPCSSNIWSCSITHVFREANSCADILAWLGHLGGFMCTFFEEIPTQLSLALAVDARGFLC